MLSLVYIFLYLVSFPIIIGADIIIGNYRYHRAVKRVDDLNKIYTDWFLSTDPIYPIGKIPPELK